MPQTPEAELFLNRVLALPNGPGVILDDALQPSLDDEAELRRLFATDRDNGRLNDLHVGLVNVFDAPDAIKTTRARVVKDDEDLSAKHIMPLSPDDRRKEGEPCMVQTLEAFKQNWSVFSEASLSALPLGKNGWNNVVAAGGSVLACLAPVPDEAKLSKRNMRKWYHAEKYPTSDIDLFLYGLTAEQAEVRINEIYEAVRDSVPWDVTCVRTTHTVSIHSQYPYRSVQIVLRLYKSPAEILAGFDIDAPCVAYDGQTLWANPRSIVAMMRQANTVDMTRRSPSYEVRLCKYSTRSFEVYVPTLSRAEIDPTIYERAIGRITGLARLLVLEKLANPQARDDFFCYRRGLRGRPNEVHSRRDRSRKYKGDLKQEKSILDDLAMNDYDVTSLHIPYGPGWDARRIDKLVYQTDLGMNSPFNPKNKDRRLHRHPAFFGTMKECLEDCCENCPEPVDDDEKELQKEEDETYTRGRISFIEEDPGRQSMTGSFNPIDVGEWSEQAYIGQTDKFFGAIALGDIDAVKALVKEQEDLDAADAAAAAEAEAQKAATAMDDTTKDNDSEDEEDEEKKITHKQRYLNRRDHVGRTALHFAILCRREEIASYLIDAGIRITSRIFDGRTALHLAVQLDQLTTVQKLLTKSNENEAAAIKAGLIEKEDVEMTDETDKRVRDSSEDDWSSDGEDEDVEMTDAEDEDDEDDEDEPKAKKAENDKEAVNVGGEPDLPEIDEDDLDILDINAPDWDLAFAPLHYAVLFGSMAVVEALLNAKANAALATKADSWKAPAFHPLTLTILRSHEPKVATQIAERLIKAGAKSSAADESFLTIFHWAVASDQIKIVECILRCDEGASSVIEFPQINWYGMLLPIVTAIAKGYYGMVAVLLAYGAKLQHTEERLSELKALAGRKAQSYFRDGGLHRALYHPVEVAVQQFDPMVELLLLFGADPNVWIKSSFDYSSKGKKTVLDWLKGAIPYVDSQLSEEAKSPSVPEPAPVKEGQSAWEAHIVAYRKSLDAVRRPSVTETKDGSEKAARIRTLTEIKTYLVAVEKQLLANGAKPGNEISPPLPGDLPVDLEFNKQTPHTSGNNNDNETDGVPYCYMSKSTYNQTPVALHEKKAYDELYEACTNGNTARIEELCLPPKTGKARSSPLQIAVNMINPNNRWHAYGYTPLYAAVTAGHWQTARLIIAIATAQHKPDEDEENFTTKDINLDSDDEGSECSDDSDMTVDQRDFEFVDIANRPSQVECEAGPKNLLDATFEAIVVNAKGEKTVLAVSLIEKAVYDGDLEAFKNLANLYAHVNKPEPLSDTVLSLILSRNQPGMLDEYIRRTGYGIAIKLDPKDEEEVRAMNDGNRVYLGLNVHGKKRADLARKNDPNAQKTVQDETPLVWQAAVQGSADVVEYLHGDKPYAAYRHYATSGGDERALKLRRYKDLEKDLPELLGWTINVLGESPLTAAILSKKLDVVKLMYKLAPKLMSSAMKQRIKFIGLNPIQVALYRGCEPQLLDFLLANGGDLFEKAQRGNAFHDICSGGRLKQFEHLANKLPRETVVAALLEMTKTTGNTPLHLAVEHNYIQIVEMILAITKDGLTIRNLSGSTPLHIAVSKGYAKIAKILVEAGPPSLLATENGVGDTPIETATFRDAVWSTREYITGFKLNFGNTNPLPFYSLNWNAGPIFKVERTKRTVPEFRETLDDLISKGKLNPDDKQTKQLFEFAGKLEKMLATESVKQAKEEEERKKKEAEEQAKKEEPEEPKRDWCDWEATLKVIKEATATIQVPRQRVHLIDVQKVVMVGMPKGNALKVKEWKDELESEEDEEEVEKRGSHLSKFISASDL